MDEVINAIRRAIIDEEEAGEMTSTSTSREEARVKPIPEAGLLSREATAAVGSAFNTLTTNCEEARAVTRGCGSRNASPHTEVMAGRKLAPRGRAYGRGRNRTGYSRTLTTIVGRQTRNLIRGVKLKSQAHAAKKGIENTIGRV
jgi:hypothetical protein